MPAPRRARSVALLSAALLLLAAAAAGMRTSAGCGCVLPFTYEAWVYGNASFKYGQPGAKLVVHKACTPYGSAFWCATAANCSKAMADDGGVQTGRYDWCQCAAGTRAELVGGAFACERCAAGSFSFGNVTSLHNCSSCAAGRFSAAAAAGCSACPVGKTSTAGAASCASCPASRVAAAAGTRCDADDSISTLLGCKCKFPYTYEDWDYNNASFAYGQPGAKLTVHRTCTPWSGQYWCATTAKCGITDDAGVSTGSYDYCVCPQGTFPEYNAPTCTAGSAANCIVNNTAGSIANFVCTWERNCSMHALDCQP